MKACLNFISQFLRVEGAGDEESAGQRWKPLHVEIQRKSIGHF